MGHGNDGNLVESVKDDYLLNAHYIPGPGLRLFPNPIIFNALLINTSMLWMKLGEVKRFAQGHTALNEAARPGIQGGDPRSYWRLSPQRASKARASREHQRKVGLSRQSFPGQSLLTPCRAAPQNELLSTGFSSQSQTQLVLVL